MSTPNFNRMEPYTLELSTGLVDRTTWWKDENTRVPSGVWWLTGNGESRPATPIEIDLWERLQAAYLTISSQMQTMHNMRAAEIEASERE